MSKEIETIRVNAVEAETYISPGSKTPVNLELHDKKVVLQYEDSEDTKRIIKLKDIESVKVSKIIKSKSDKTSYAVVLGTIGIIVGWLFLMDMWYGSAELKASYNDVWTEYGTFESWILGIYSFIVSPILAIFMFTLYHVEVATLKIKSKGSPLLLAVLGEERPSIQKFKELIEETL